MMDDVWMVLVEVSGDGNVTLAKATVPGVDLVGKGSSRRHPVDKNQEETGAALAVGRALQALGKRMERRILGLVKHQDDMADQKSKLRVVPSATATTRGVAGYPHSSYGFVWEPTPPLPWEWPPPANIPIHVTVRARPVGKETETRHAWHLHKQESDPSKKETE